MKYTAKDVVNMIDFSGQKTGPMNHQREDGGWYGEGCFECMPQLNQIAESLSLDGTDVDGNEKIYHVQWSCDGEWKETYWNVNSRRKPAGDMRLRMSFDDAVKSLGIALDYHPTLKEKFRIHADRVVE